MSEFDLSRGLRELSGAPRIDGPAVPVDRVTTRVRRGRAWRATGVTAACVAAVVGVAGTVWAVGPFDAVPVPPATPTPSATSTTSPTPTPSPTRPSVLTETPAPPEPDAVPPLVAVTAAGDLVVLDPGTGVVERTVERAVEGYDPEDTETEVAVSPSPDGRTVYLSHGHRDAEDTYVWEMYRTDLETGTVEKVADGASGPAVSPDGRTVAWFASSPDGELNPSSDSPVWGITVLDVESGTTRFLPQWQAHQETPRNAFDWSADGTRLIVSTDDLTGIGVRVLDVESETFDDAEPLAADDCSWWSGTGRLSDGRVLVACTENVYESYFASTTLLVLDGSTGEVLDRVGTGGRRVASIAAGPDTDGAYVVLQDYDNDAGEPLGSSLHRWSDDGGLEHVVDDVVAVGW